MSPRKGLIEGYVLMLTRERMEGCWEHKRKTTQGKKEKERERIQEKRRKAANENAERESS